MKSNQMKLLGIAFSVTLLGVWMASPAEAQERRTAKRSSSSSSQSSSSSKARSSSPSGSRSQGTRSTATRSTATRSDGSKQRSSSSANQNQRELRSKWNGKSQGSHHPRYPRHPYYWGPNYDRYRYYWSPYFSWYGYYPWYYYGGRSTHHRYEPGPEMGGLDFDVTPERAEIYVDGKPIGQADDYDGFPTYLWLPKGTYDVVIYHPGYESISRQYSVYAGVIIDIEDEMRPGEARRPEALVSQSTVRRDARIRADRDREREVSADEYWRDRREDDGEDEAADDVWRRREVDEEESWEEVKAQETEAKSELTGVLYLDVNPVDAAVYVDGRFMGTAEEFGRSVGLVLDPGEHKLSVVHPQFSKIERQLEVEPGEALRLKIDLDD